MTQTISRRAMLGSLAAIPALAQDSADKEKQSKLWNGVYSTPSDMVTPYPNHFLADSIRSLTPGKALDIGAGQGRNSLYLARQGWDVTGIDISDAGIEIARKQAAKSNLKFSGSVADFTTYDIGARPLGTDPRHLHGRPDAPRGRASASCPPAQQTWSSSSPISIPKAGNSFAIRSTSCWKFSLRSCASFSTRSSTTSRTGATAAKRSLWFTCWRERVKNSLNPCPTDL